MHLHWAESSQPPGAQGSEGRGVLTPGETLDLGVREEREIPSPRQRAHQALQGARRSPGPGPTGAWSPSGAWLCK